MACRKKTVFTFYFILYPMKLALEHVVKVAASCPVRYPFLSSCRPLTHFIIFLRFVVIRLSFLLRQVFYEILKVSISDDAVRCFVI